jgi:hypothetical protein
MLNWCSTSITEGARDSCCLSWTYRPFASCCPFVHVTPSRYENASPANTTYGIEKSISIRYSVTHRTWLYYRRGQGGLLQRTKYSRVHITMARGFVLKHHTKWGTMIWTVHRSSGANFVCWSSNGLVTMEIAIRRCVKVCSVVDRYRKNSMVWVRERTIPTERPPLVGEVIANFWG